MKALSIVVLLFVLAACGNRQDGSSEPAPSESSTQNPTNPKPEKPSSGGGENGGSNEPSQPSPPPKAEKPVPDEPQPGEPDPGDPGDPGPGVPEPTWENVSQLIFKPKCVACHNPSGQVPWVDVATYEAFISNGRMTEYDPNDPQKNRLIERVMETQNPMPPKNSGLERLTSEELELLLKWYEAGLPEV